MIESSPEMIMYGPSITKMSLDMIAFVLEIMICNTEIIVSFRSGNCYLHLGDIHLRSEDDCRRWINNRVRQRNGSLQHDNDLGRCANIRLRGEKDQDVGRVDRRPNGNTCFAIVNHYRRRGDDRQRSGVDRDNGSIKREDGEYH